MAVVSMKQLLESGVHFGHATRRWNPKMKPYIFTDRNGIYIIDLKKTVVEIEKAYNALLEIVQNGGKVLFIGTKKQAQETVKEEAKRTGQFYVDQRWLGGTLTNFKTIRRRIKFLHDLYKMEEDGTFEKLPKKEVVGLVKQRDRLENFLGGIKDMKKVPEAIFIVDPRKEQNAILEARKLGIKVFGIVDTNCDPDDVDYIIPANDDAIRAVKLITHVMANAVIEAQGGYVEKIDDAEAMVVPKREPRAPRRERPAHTPRPTREKTEEKKTEAPKKEAVKSAPKKAEPAPKKEKPVKAEEPVKKEAVKPAPKKAEAKKEDLSKHTVAELRALAKERDLHGYSTLKKAELIDLLNA